MTSVHLGSGRGFSHGELHEVVGDERLRQREEISESARDKGQPDGLMPAPIS